MDKITLTGCKSSNLNALSNETRALQTHPSHPCSAKYLALGFLGCDGRGGEKTFHHCRTFLCNFPTLHVFSLWKCVQEGERERERERERDPITCLSQDDSSVCGKALHPLAFTFPHPHPNLPPAKGKIAQLAKAITERQGIYSLCFHSTPRSTFLGRWSSPPRPPWRTGDGWDDAKGAL